MIDKNGRKIETYGTCSVFGDADIYITSPDSPVEFRLDLRDARQFGWDLIVLAAEAEARLRIGRLEDK